MYFDGVALSELLRYFDRPLEIFASPFSDFFSPCAISFRAACAIKTRWPVELERTLQTL